MWSVLCVNFIDIIPQVSRTPWSIVLFLDMPTLKLPSKHSSWWRRLSSSSSEDVFKTSSRRLNQDEYVRLSLTTSEDVFKTSWRRLGRDEYIRLGHMSSRLLQDVFKTSSRCLQGVFKTFLRRLAKISSKRFQGVPPD